jgi:hypothetical protein
MDIVIIPDAALLTAVSELHLSVRFQYKHDLPLMTGNVRFSQKKTFQTGSFMAGLQQLRTFPLCNRNFQERPETDVRLQTKTVTEAAVSVDIL